MNASDPRLGVDPTKCSRIPLRTDGINAFDRRLGAEPAHDYERISRAIHFLRENFLAQPSLAEVAASVHLSPYHFQRLFTRWAGVSPKRFGQFLTVEHAKAQLAQGRDVLGASLEAGLSSPGRLHDLFVTIDAMTPGEFKRGGAGLTIRHGVHATPFGWAAVAGTARGLCALSFWDTEAEARAASAELRARWPRAELVADDEAGARWIGRMFRAGAGEPVPLLLAGTNFQLQVWQALLAIAPGGLASYEDVAAQIGLPSAARAVGHAVGRNAIAFLIPCHRVIKKTGVIGDYRWGSTRKHAMLGWEASRAALVRTA